MRGVVVDACSATAISRRLAQRRAGVQVAVVLGEGAGGDLHADAVARAEDLAGVPAVNAVAVDRPGSISDGASMPSRKRARTMPSQRRWAKPLGCRSNSIAMKSVSGAEDAA